MSNERTFGGDSLEECLRVEEIVYLEDVPIVEHIDPREIPWDSPADEFSVPADLFTLNYRRAFRDLMKLAAAPERERDCAGLTATAVAERVRTQSLTMTAVRRGIDDVVEIVLAAPDGSTLPAWEPGAHIDVTLPSGTVRQYSLCSDPSDLRTYRIAVRRCAEGRGGSVELHEVAASGAVLEVSAPRNTFALEPARRYVLVAGGVGITALLAMARRLDATGADVTLLYVGRGPMPFVDEVRALRSTDVRIVDTAQDFRPDVATLLADAASSAVYACGPESLLADVTAACDDMLPADGLHLERFAPTAVGDDGASFEVELARSGTSVEVGASTSVLDALRDAGYDASSSCEQGICGTCETRVLSGAVDHRDDILTDAEKAAGDTMMICVSRCTSGRLVLDL